MDFPPGSGQPFFGACAQSSYAPFMHMNGLPPQNDINTTNTNSNGASSCANVGAGSADFCAADTSPPPPIFDGFAPADQFSSDRNNGHIDSFSFDAAAAAQFNASPHTSSFAPPTPPILSHAEQTPPRHASSQPLSAGPMSAGQMHMQNFNFDPSRDDIAGRRGGSNSEDEELTPAQSRRKAQNRAAQRAFRERKERHVKELEEKLATLEASSQQTSSENEQLRRRIEKMSTENQILRATGAAAAAASGSGAAQTPQTTTGPMAYNPDAFYDDMLANHSNKTRSHRVVVSETGERLLAIGATWDLIVNHELFQLGKVNLVDISEKLKMQVRCDGQGPVFCENDIRRVIEETATNNLDDDTL
ncbi:Fluconazole resistance protein 3 [Ceratocystis lukuohia]|uniref:Fluconazole resistance protein 3 n=1 Tax=Ceratocystis lukuohia TaxID=2019550 RepID=A0ABR4MLM3_9PEZI